MKASVLLQALLIPCLAASATAVFAQTNSIQLFGPADIRLSTQGAGYDNSAVLFNTTHLNLSCDAQNISAILSSTPDGAGNVLVDNYIELSVGQYSAVNLCTGGTSEHGNQQNCFTPAYASQAQSGSQDGHDPDALLPTGGVAPIDISSYFTAGPVQATISLVDTGGYLAGSNLYLVTNCTTGGVTGPAVIIGNPISQNNPTDQQLNQSFTFNSADNLEVQLTYNLIEAEQAQTLTIKDGTVPQASDKPLDPNAFQAKYLPGTSFATADCLIHSGELLNNAPACKLYTLTCQVGTNANQAGALCPSSSARNELFQEAFDGPSFTLPDLATPNGPTFHQGVALLEASDDWSGGSCVFDPASSLASTLCPQNLLTSFTGPGLYKSGGRGQSPNSTFISIAPVPEDLTTVTVAGQRPGYWINTSSATVNFVSTPPTVPSSLPGAGNFIAAPIYDLTYGVSTPSTVPQPGAPVAGDTELDNSIQCPSSGSSNPVVATPFVAPTQLIPLSDGKHLVHYLAQDCAGTEELKFTNSAGSWATSFYTYPINVDTVAPTVVAGPTLSPASANGYVVGQKVTATYRCTDDRSGIVRCGSSTYPPESTDDTGNLTSPIDTSKPGPGTFTVVAIDAAGNQTTASVNYQVTGSPANVYLLKLAAPRVKSGAALTYAIGASNFSKNATAAVTITDPLPAGVTFVRARAEQFSCGHGQCTNLASCSYANNTVSCTSPSLTANMPIVVLIDVRVQAQAGTTIANTATLSTTTPVASRAHEQSTATTVVH